MHTLQTVLFKLPKALTIKENLFEQLRASIVCDHFLYFRDTDVWFRDHVKRDYNC